jgi:hypothetical protein
VLGENLQDGAGVAATSKGTTGTGLVAKGWIGADVTGEFTGAKVTGKTFGASVNAQGVGLAASADQVAIMASVYKGKAIIAASTEQDTIVTTVLQLGAAIHVKAGNPGAPSTYAGLFEGDVTINGTLRKTNDKFLIDHPLDPANKYLEHSTVESNEMKNIYDGTVTLDRRGRAVVRLPAWFVALNEDFRYQLTPIGQSAPDLHVAREVADDRFEIAGGAPGTKVCWQITGTRCDVWARAHPMKVEIRKSRQEKGRYLHPELFGAPDSQGVFAVGSQATDDFVEKQRRHLEQAATARQSPVETGPSRRRLKAPAPPTFNIQPPLLHRQPGD